MVKKQYLYAGFRGGWSYIYGFYEYSMGFFRNFLKGASLTTALFVFQACYGTPKWLHDEDMSFRVVSAVDETPIENVSIFTRVYKSDNLDWNLCGYTNESGVANVMVGIMDDASPEFRFEAEDGAYAVKDTVIENWYQRTIKIRLQKAE